MGSVEIEKLVKRFDSSEIVRNIDLQIGDGEFVVFVGPSGCGKSTILRMIAGLESITAGEIRIGGRRINELPPKDRRVAMVFQDYALYPHMTVEENLSFGLRMQGVAAADRRRIVVEAAQHLQIDHLLSRRPKHLSGGQRQRVAMGRAIVRRADVFLFDEPLSSLDAKLRVEMRAQIKRLHLEVGTTSIFVTHDQVEAMTLADRIYCLLDGSIAQTGTPDEIYNQPANLFVASFIGSPGINRIEGIIEIGDNGARLRLADGACLALPGFAWQRAATMAGRHVILGLRPEHFSDAQHFADRADAVPIDMVVSLIETLGSDTYMHGIAFGQNLVARCSPRLKAGYNDHIVLYADLRQGVLFDHASGAAV